MSGGLTYLIDTSWLVKHLRRKDRYSAKLTVFRREGLAVSIVTVAELFHGVARAREPARAEGDLQTFLDEVTVLAVDRETCRIFGRLAAQLHSRNPGDFDLLIGATALQYGLTVLTTDKEHFSRMEGIALITEP